MEIESLILEKLTENDDFVRGALPYLEAEYFPMEHHQKLFNLINGYVSKYNHAPTRDALIIELGNIPNLTQSDYDNINTELKGWTSADVDHQWMMDSTEKWCQDRALFNALSGAVAIAQSADNKDIGRGEIPELLSQALGVSFDSSIGLRYIGDAEKRFDQYHNVVAKYPISLSKFNHYMDGGPEDGTLNVVMASTGVGKSIMLCQIAADYMLQGKKVLYITMEMGEHKITERIDANMLDVDINKIKGLSKGKFGSLMAGLTKRTAGELVVRQFPTGQGHTGHFRHLLGELRMKQQFVPDVIVVDYINICASSRLGRGGTSSYEYVKAVTEELRGLAVEFNLPMWTATQSNRGAANSSQVGIDDVGESWGLPQTADFMCVLISDDDLKKSGQMMVKILKNRYGPADVAFMVNVDYPKMRIFDQDEPAANDPGPDNVPWDEHGEVQDKFAAFQYGK